MKRRFFIAAVVLSYSAVAQQKPLPIIDMHLHALPATWGGGPAMGICSPFEHWHVADSANKPEQYYIDVVSSNLYCNGVGFRSPMTDDSIMHGTLEVMEKYNVYAVTSGPLMHKWRQISPTRIIPGFMFSPDMGITTAQIKNWFLTDSMRVLGEIVGQYNGITLSDSIMEPYLALAEELDIPISVHVGPGPPGIAYAGAGNYRARFHSALVIEEALIRHPKLRVIVAHAGWPMLDDMLAVLYTHPHVYVDVGIICYAFPRKEFYHYLERLVNAGFGKRICFGSDQMIWPQTLEAGIQSINDAPFLTQEEKRDILYNNAARFLRLTAEQIKEHHR